MSPHNAAFEATPDQTGEGADELLIEHLGDRPVVIDLCHTLPPAPRELPMPAKAVLTRGERWRLCATGAALFAAAIAVVSVYVGLPMALAARSLLGSARWALTSALVGIVVTFALIVMVLRCIVSTRHASAPTRPARSLLGSARWALTSALVGIVVTFALRVVVLRYIVCTRPAPTRPARSDVIVVGRGLELSPHSGPGGPHYALAAFCDPFVR